MIFPRALHRLRFMTTTNADLLIRQRENLNSRLTDNLRMIHSGDFDYAACRKLIDENNWLRKMIFEIDAKLEGK